MQHDLSVSKSIAQRHATTLQVNGIVGLDIVRRSGRQMIIIGGVVVFEDERVSAYKQVI